MSNTIFSELVKIIVPKPKDVNYGLVSYYCLICFFLSLDKSEQAKLEETRFRSFIGLIKNIENFNLIEIKPILLEKIKLIPLDELVKILFLCLEWIIIDSSSELLYGKIIVMCRSY